MIHDRTSFFVFSIFFAKEGDRNGPKLTFSISLAEKVFLETLMEMPVMGRGEADKKRNVDRVDRVRFHFCRKHLVSDCEQRQNIEPIVLGFVTQIGNALFREGIVFTVPKDVVALDSRLGCGFDRPEVNKSVGVLMLLFP